MNPVNAAELGIRPEHIDVVDLGTGDFDAVADVVEHLGSDTNLFVRIEGIGPMMVRVHGNIPKQPGDSVGLKLQRENIHLFATDGQRLRAEGALAA
ncbi:MULTISPECIES: TOBE domain-containing protein [unclassified Sulfitobacter]|uniref:TOBE domain-containing protein n=1 Tax=unclassified Sulfitobacter TaxID=196795 RepID=UPI0023E25B2F|nr:MULTISPECIES: TOBE domain-containing protein [unclassified Sulfitobacter]